MFVSRVAQLEQKLDGIMSLLESNQRAKRRRSSSAAGSASTPDDASSPPTPDSPGDDLTANNPWQFRNHHPDSCPNRAPGEHALTSSGSSNGSEERPTAETVVELVPGLALTFAEAAEHLAVYRRDYMPLFPFVVIEEGAKPQELHRSAPALFWMIVAAVAQTSEETDRAVKRWLRHHVAETMIIKQEKTLELLQAILVHLIWGSFHFYIDAETPLFMQLAHNIVLDLKLDWPPEQGQVYKHSLLGAAWCHMNKSHLLRRRKEHTPAEIRAVLGLHYATSVTMSMFRRGPALAWNSYLAKCCDSIAALCQHPLDEALAASVRLQRIAQKGLSALPGTEYVWGPSATVYGYAQEMTLSLTRDNMDNLPSYQLSHTPSPMLTQIFPAMFRHLYLALLVRLYEPVLGMQPAAGPPDNGANSTAHAPLRRTEMLWRLVDACRALFTARNDLPVAQAALRPSTMTGFLAFAVVTASRALFHAAEDWDPAVARRAFDFGAATLATAAQFERAEAWARAAGRRRPMHAKTPLFTLYSQKLRWIHQWYEARSAADGGGAAGTPAEGEEAMAMITPPEEEDVQGQEECAVDGAATLEGLDMLGTDQQPIPSFLPDFQFDEAFWQDMLLGTPQPAFGQYNMGHGVL
ncbi:Fungal transcriptional regulatory protein [Cordyceps fumosorosea ARSEF 2679]|uniref:Fungal transcriptional regulatory protein n=1 Tax=Cordyceps fumosorosea (strain ARSEF 2679) TaxID=1081104 RepID=A0A167R7M2_CORFA|nr:Fungal transcriptional regulatory protein [Cordyceps fumosorosea ARSEF 2679]OAA58347.1 Fungal transcriptional regulatory protein [Cordyceps fumosorosea ARSEF 2679]